MVQRVAASRERVRDAKRSGGGNYFASPQTSIKFIPSGSKVFDLALGGGWARSRISNVVGDKSTGKTLLCIEASANFIRGNPKGKVRYREAEAAFDEPYAAALGMPVDKVDFGDPLDTVEQLWADLERIVAGAKGPELVIVDSLDALSDDAEMAREMTDPSFGASKAKQLSQLFRRLVRKMEGKDVTLIIVSQIRDKIGATFGRKFTRSGGKALDFYASQVPYLAHIGQLHRTISKIKRASGVNIKAKLDKNKVGLPFREAEFPILFGWGVDDIASCLTFLKETGALKEAGYGKTMTDTDILAHSRDFMEAPVDEYDDEREYLHQCVVKRWHQIETTLLPSRTKYGN